jgi:phosphorylcholine metabolism protein LicD
MEQTENVFVTSWQDVLDLFIEREQYTQLASVEEEKQDSLPDVSVLVKNE